MVGKSTVILTVVSNCERQFVVSLALVRLQTLDGAAEGNTSRYLHGRICEAAKNM